MNRKRRLKVQDFNRHLTCSLCGGYFIDATTIIECLHSFCRACIVQYLQHNRFCPVCDVQVHKSKPLLNIRNDGILQDLVYKLVPGLFQREMRCRQEFMSDHPGASVCPPPATEVSPIYTPDECFSITLEYWRHAGEDASCKPAPVKQEVGSDASAPGEGADTAGRTRYLRCPAAVTVAHLGKLLLAKYGLHAAGPPSHTIQFLHKDHVLHEHLMLMDVAYIYKWRRIGPLNISYRIFENSCKRMKLETSVVSKNCCAPATEVCVFEAEHASCKSLITNKDLKEKISDWKEVQLQISETGIMSVSGISVEHKNNTKDPACPIKEQPIAYAGLTKPSAQVCPRAIKHEVLPSKETPSESGKPRVAGVAKPSAEGLPPKVYSVHSNSVNFTNKVPKKKDDKLVPHVQQRELLDLSLKPGAPKVHKLSSVPAELTEIASCNLTGTSLISSKSCRAPSMPVHASQTGNLYESLKQDFPGEPYQNLTAKKNPLPKNTHSIAVSPPQTTKRSSNSNSMGYKTLKVPPKTWNPSITRSTYLNSQKHNLNSDSPDSSKSSSSAAKSTEKAPKFFKMRNMPRYLGNPASGVKPMYQVVNDSKAQELVAKTKQTVIKIDPKTLTPIISGGSVSSPAMPEHSGSPSKAFYSPALSVGSEGKSASIPYANCARDMFKQQSPYKSGGSSPFRNSTSTSRVANNSNASASLAKSPVTTVTSSSGNSNEIYQLGSTPSHSTSPKNVRMNPQTSFALNTATLNLLSSNLSFLPNSSNFLYGNFSGFGPPLMRPGLNLSTGVTPACSNSSSNLGIAAGSLPPGLGAFHSMPPTINMLFPHLRTGDRPSVGHAQTPAVQRIPASKGNSNVSAASSVKACVKSTATGQKSNHNQAASCPKIVSHSLEGTLPHVNDNNIGETSDPLRSCCHPEGGDAQSQRVHGNAVNLNPSDTEQAKVNTPKKVKSKEEPNLTLEDTFVLCSVREEVEVRPSADTSKGLDQGKDNAEKYETRIDSVSEANANKADGVEAGVRVETGTTVNKVEKVETGVIKQSEVKSIPQKGAEIFSRSEAQVCPDTNGTGSLLVTEAKVNVGETERVGVKLLPDAKVSKAEKDDGCGSSMVIAMKAEAKAIVTEKDGSIQLQTVSKVEAKVDNATSNIAESVLVTSATVLTKVESNVGQDSSVLGGEVTNNNVVGPVPTIGYSKSDEVSDTCANSRTNSTVEIKEKAAGIDRAFEVKTGI